jgi:hypothetical protein
MPLKVDHFDMEVNANESRDIVLVLYRGGEEALPCVST